MTDVPKILFLQVDWIIKQSCCRTWLSMFSLISPSGNLSRLISDNGFPRCVLTFSANSLLDEPENN